MSQNLIHHPIYVEPIGDPAERRICNFVVKIMRNSRYFTQQKEQKSAFIWSQLIGRKLGWIPIIPFMSQLPCLFAEFFQDSQMKKENACRQKKYTNTEGRVGGVDKKEAKKKNKR